jgi:hypothetical protein
MISVSEEMAKKLEEERKKRLLDSIPETIRVVLSEHFSKR